MLDYTYNNTNLDDIGITENIIAEIDTALSINRDYLEMRIMQRYPEKSYEQIKYLAGRFAAAQGYGWHREQAIRKLKQTLEARVRGKRQRDLDCLKEMTELYRQLQTMYPDHENLEFKAMTVTMVLAGNKSKSLASWAGELLKWVNSPVPNAIQTLLNATSACTGNPIFKKLGSAGRDIHGVLSNSIGLVNSFGIPLPAHLASFSGSAGALAKEISQLANLSAAAPFLPVLQLLGTASTAINVFNANSPIQGLYGLLIRHGNAQMLSSCPTMTIITDTIDRREANVGLSTCMLHPVVALILGSTKIWKKLKHKWRKQQGTEPHTPDWHAAKYLLDAARGTVPHQHEDSPYTMQHPEGCPLAWLTLATLFGHGDPTKGSIEAVATVLARQDKAIPAVQAYLH